MPTLLVAATPSGRPTDTHIDYPQGYYADGAYTAITKIDNDVGTQHSDEEDPQEAYYTSLLKRFAELSSLLQHSPTVNNTLSLVMNTAQALNSGSNSRWRSVLGTRPSMVLTGLLSQEAVLQGLRKLENQLTIEKLGKTNYIGLWAWGLLGRCRDVGQMDSEAIGILRDLGKKAICLLRGIQASSHGFDDDYGDSDISGVENGGGLKDFEMSQRSDSRNGSLAPEPMTTSAIHNPASFPVQTLSGPLADAHSIHELDAEKAKKAASLLQETGISSGVHKPRSPTSSSRSPLPPSSDQQQDTSGHLNQETEGGQWTQIRATLDIIITVVGECYGQKDLLDGRLVWGELDGDKR